LLDNRQSQPDALVIELGCAMKLSESREKLFNLSFWDANACVVDLGKQKFGSLLVTDLNSDAAT